MVTRRPVELFDPDYLADEREGSVVERARVGYTDATGRHTRVWTVRFRNGDVRSSYDEFAETHLLQRAIQHYFHGMIPDRYSNGVARIAIHGATLLERDVPHAETEHVYISVDAVEYRPLRTFAALHRSGVCAVPHCGDWGCDSCQ
jgi:hypothetical protein